jgi:two-component system, chemotaxis family, chemotaxis protein CheY
MSLRDQRCWPHRVPDTPCDTHEIHLRLISSWRMRKKHIYWHASFCEESGMRVLIADDQKSVGTSLAELVQFCRHEVVEVVSSGLEALQAYERHRPDVVLMDYQMPKLNGATACRNIVAKHPDARIILVSGSPREIAGSGALALLIKPVNLDQLYAALYNAARPPASEME